MITFEIHGLPKMANGGHGHWRADYAHKQMWRKMATFTRCSSSEPDDDGLVHGFKATRDALKHFGVIVDDRPSCLKSEYKWERAKRGAGKIKVSVEQL
jgi:hypothetical protein